MKLVYAVSLCSSGHWDKFHHTITSISSMTFKMEMFEIGVLL